MRALKPGTPQRRLLVFARHLDVRRHALLPPSPVLYLEARAINVRGCPRADASWFFIKTREL